MRIIRLLPLLGLLALSLLGTLHAQQYSPVKQRMSAAEFRATGLNKLSPQELQALDAWLRGHAPAATRVVDTTGAPVFYPDSKSRQTFIAHVAGHFDGWHGGDRLTLDNGQVWKEVGSDVPSCMTADQPTVKVKPSMMGNWLMYVSGCNDTVHVQRVH